MVKLKTIGESAWFPAVVLVILTLIVAAPLFSSDWFLSHEGNHPLQRIVALAEEIRHGDLYPRWLSSTYSGKGSPFFNFYSPGAYLFPAYLYTAGLPLLFSIKTTAVLVFFCGAWGMYLWSRRHFENLGGLISAIIYLFLPYHFVDIYVRGAFAEFAALALLPYLFLFIDQTIEQSKSVTSVVLMGVSAAAILLAHNLSAFMIMPMAILYAILRILTVKNRGLQICRLLAGGIIGVGLSSFYWLPLLIEQKYLHDFTSLMTSGYNAVEMHFVEPEQWFSTFWGFGGSNGPGVPDEMSFQLGIVLLGALALILPIGGLFVARPSFLPVAPMRRHAVFILLLCGASSLFMTCSAAAFVYRYLKIFAILQFPWRYLGPTTLFFSAGCGALAFYPRIRRYTLPFLLILVGASLFFSTDQRTVQPINGDIEGLISSQGVGALCGIDEYLPKFASVESININTGAMPHAPTGTITQLTVDGKVMSFTLDGREQQNPITLPWFYFPGWEAMLDKHTVPVVSSPEGFAMLIAEPGKHRVEVRFGTTVPRIIGWLVFGLTVVVIVIVWAMRSDRFKRWCKRMMVDSGESVLN